MKYVVGIYGWVDVEAETEEQALEKANEAIQCTGGEFSLQVDSRDISKEE